MSISDLEKKLTDSKVEKEKVQLFIELSKANLEKSPEKALEYAEQAIELSKKLELKDLIAKSYSNMGNNYQELCDNALAFRFYLKELKVYKSDPINFRKNYLLSCLMKLGNVCSNLSDYQEALEYYHEALKIAENNRNKTEIAGILNKMGSVYYFLNKDNDALNYYREALKLRKEIGDEVGIGGSYNNMGIMYATDSQYDKALEYYQKSLKIKNIDFKIQTNMEINSRIEIEINKEFDYNTTFAKSNKEFTHQIEIANTLNNIGVVYEEKKEYFKALNYYYKSLVIKKKIMAKNGIPSTINNICESYFQLKQYDRVLRYAEKSLELSKEIKSKDMMMDCYEQFTQLYSETKNFEKAFHYSKMYSEIKDNIYSEESCKKLAEMQTKYETEKKDKEAEIYKLRNVELANANQQLEKEITVRKKAEETIKVGRERLKMLNKIIRHDLSNDFIVIKSAVRLFKKKSNPSMLDEIERRTDKSLKIITSYKKYESFIDENLDLEEIVVNELLNDLICDFPNIKFNISGKCKVYADKTLNSVFKNLIRNSVKHGKATQIDIKTSTKDNMCSIKFCDNGVGIPSDIIDNIFDEGFYYGKSGHSGVGLHIVQKTVERFGGSVSVENNDPIGAVFVLNLRKTF